MTRKYYLSPLMKGMMMFTLVMLTLPLLGLFLLLFVAGVFHLPILSVVLIMIVSVGGLLAALIWRLATPAVEISEAGIKVSVPFLYKSNSARWDEIEGMTFGKIRTFGMPDKQLKILLKSEGIATKEIILSLKAVEKPDEIVAKIKQHIPELTHEHLMQSKVLQQPVTKSEIKFRQWRLIEEGIAGSKVLVPWNDVKAISYSGLVIGGYGATTITYNDKKGKEKSLIIRPKTSSEYQDFIRYAIQHASNASIDPGAVKALEYKLEDARKDSQATALLILAFIFLFALPLFVGPYLPPENTWNVYPLALIPLAVIPMGVSVKLLASRFRGKAERSEKKLLWSGFASGLPVAGVLLVFILTPFSRYYLVGDLAMKTNNLLGAEYWYRNAQKAAPDSHDLAFDMAIMSRKKKEYETAFGYLCKIYAENPKFFGPLGVELIPDTLFKMGRYDEAISWCDKILDSNPRNRGVQQVIGKKRNEILAEKAQNAPLKEESIHVSN